MAKARRMPQQCQSPWGNSFDTSVMKKTTKYPASPYKPKNVSIEERDLWLAAPNTSNNTLPSGYWTLELHTDRNLLFATEPVNLTNKVANLDTIVSILWGNCLVETNEECT
ncbi:hypothetical protein PsorP6_008946 [Peronosclerospora sorghi]|uniref:Uncharacterized protein n=1 Tax=Peronosclerospora sorghi TaxID=230839 RepID=A0ACC0W1Z3_9STRA|nr:hypothetical protein PsorP6_008946 [Peronosclerospora sorghi]